jgi:hypothetical protein
MRTAGAVSAEEARMADYAVDRMSASRCVGNFLTTSLCPDCNGLGYLELTRSEALYLGPRNRTARAWGLAVGATGAALMGASFLMFSGLLLHAQTEEQPPESKSLAWGAVVTLSAGIPATAVGWVMYKRNVAFEVERTPLGLGTTTVDWRFGVTPTRGGANLGFELSF